ncbi:beta-lactamase/transpeptidase-like protein [Corynespora cassiicola Philippines]|uniref:Beta-lactamase/transpeptidase-like protein n=1 Tax=Corynespora cassiicola Philippines TaxID=1448308 RepID=A0A2T2P338_CORCC|nr:beta-lactamase/transpeptidase-like protein [Corynespora cassiicola Philippines]
MRHSFRLAVSLCAASPVVADFLGPRYVPPVDLSSDKSTIPAAWKKATADIQSALNGDENSTLADVVGLKNVTFSLGMFSLHDPSASKLQFHYTSPEIIASNGTHKVDGDSIYKVASITKVFTVLTGLLNLNMTDWERPVTEIFPALAEFAKTYPGQDDPAYTIRWEQVTLSNLAAQIAGLPTNPLVGDTAISYLLQGRGPEHDGYPMVNISSPRIADAIPVLPGFLAGTSTYTTDNFIPMVKAALPNFAPWTQPLYSNNGFVLLTAAIGSITGQSLSSLSQKTILDPLGLTSSFYNVVPASLSERSVIANDYEWKYPAGIAEGSGGLASTTNDLAKFGVAVLNSTLLPEAETRRWLKPVSHTGRFEYAMGRPWEILRYTHASGAVTDLYTKAGDSGSYGSYLVIIPDYNAGFTVLGAASVAVTPTRVDVIAAIGDVLANTILPALEEQAAAETKHNFAGTYASSIEGLNSSVILSVNETEGAAPGLLIESFISNGTDFSSTFPLYYKPGSRLTPSILTDKSGKLAFRVALADDAPSIDKRKALFTGAGSANFLVSDAASYGGSSLSHWVFQVDDKGKATWVSPTWLQATYDRKE